MAVNVVSAELRVLNKLLMGCGIVATTVIDVAQLANLKFLNNALFVIIKLKVKDRLVA